MVLSYNVYTEYLFFYHLIGKENYGFNLQNKFERFKN